MKFSFSLIPESLGIIKTFLSSISSKASCVANNIELPISSNSPVNGARRPILIFFSEQNRLKLKKKYYIS